eukprot:g457.t1
MIHTTVLAASGTETDLGDLAASCTMLQVKRRLEALHSWPAECQELFYISDTRSEDQDLRLKDEETVGEVRRYGEKEKDDPIDSNATTLKLCVNVDSLVGRWEKQEHTREVRKDGHFQKSSEQTVLWLRADGRAQLLRCSRWTSYHGDKEEGEEFGSGSSTMTIETRQKRARSKLADGFLDGNAKEEAAEKEAAERQTLENEANEKEGLKVRAPRRRGRHRGMGVNDAGLWELVAAKRTKEEEQGAGAGAGKDESGGEGEGDGQTTNKHKGGAHIKVTGAGWFSAGAFEDDDILCNGGGPKSNVEFEVSVGELRSGMNEFNNAKLAAKKAAGVNIHLYSNDHPEVTQSGTGFKDAATARRTLELVKQKPRNRQVWTVNAMYHRAKHHPNQTASMREAMAIFQTWLDEYSKEKESQKSAKSGGKRTAVAQPLQAGGKKQKIRSRSELEQEYKTLYNITLPAVAKAQSWPIFLNHCLMRVALDGYWQCCWYDKLDQRKGALKSMTSPQIENVIAVGERMAKEGKAYVQLNPKAMSAMNMQERVSRLKESLGFSAIHAVKVAKCWQQQLQQQQQRVQQAQPHAETATAAGGKLRAAVQAASKNVSSNSSSASTDTSAHTASSADSSDSNSSSETKKAKGQLQIGRASSGRASCRGCKEKIGKGEYRIGVQAWTSGRQVTVWHHPCCFVRKAPASSSCSGDSGDGGDEGSSAPVPVVRVEKVVRGSSARCKSTGVKFPKGSLRGVVQVGSTKHYYALGAFAELLQPVFALVEGETSVVPVAKSVEDVSGMGQLDEKERQEALAALRGGGAAAAAGGARADDSVDDEEEEEEEEEEDEEDEDEETDAADGEDGEEDEDEVDADDELSCACAPRASTHWLFVRPAMNILIFIEACGQSRISLPKPAVGTTLW